MKNFFLTCTSILMLLSIASFGQVKIGNNPTTINANSLLELETTNKGLLMPRVALTSTALAAPLSAHVAGMTVYNTATAGTSPTNVVPGYYYNDGTQWIKTMTGTEWYLNASGTIDAEGAKTTDIYRPNAIKIGPATAGGYSELKPGSSARAGYFTMWNSTQRVGFIGWDSTNVYYNAERGGKAAHQFSGSANNSATSFGNGGLITNGVAQTGFYGTLEPVIMGINTATPTQTLDVNGSARIRYMAPIPDGTVVQKVGFDYQGNLIKEAHLDNPGVYPGPGSTVGMNFTGKNSTTTNPFAPGASTPKFVFDGSGYYASKIYLIVGTSSGVGYWFIELNAIYNSNTGKINLEYVKGVTENSLPSDTYSTTQSTITINENGNTANSIKINAAVAGYSAAGTPTGGASIIITNNGTSTINTLLVRAEKIF